MYVPTLISALLIHASVGAPAATPLGASAPVANKSPAAEKKLAILGGDLVLSADTPPFRMVAEWIEGTSAVGEASAQWTIENPTLLKIEKGVAVPLRDGTTTIVARAGDQVARVTVTVKNSQRPSEWSFRNHIQSVLAKGGCNSGACHGALAGKNGFRLSLRGYDAEGDFLVLTHQAKGRRVDRQEPSQSLLLRKPMALLPHGGGKKIEPDSLEYRVLAEWISAGAPAPKPEDPRLAGLEIFPARSIQRPMSNQQIVVRARFTDGHIEDVTRWAKFSTTNAEVATVDDQGNVAIVGPGEGAIAAWYLNSQVIATVTVPYAKAPDPAVFARSPRRNVIDDLVLAKLKRLNVPPSGQSSADEFLRRAYLDALGVLPTAAEARAFFADEDKNKREKLIEQLLERPEFVDLWTYKWSDLLLVSSEKLAPAAMWAYYDWIRRAVSSNLPWNELAKGVLTARGNTLENGATNFYVIHQDPLELIEACSQTFLGMSISCARCHNHPLEKWTNDQYYGMANLVARVRLKDQVGEGSFAVYTTPQGDLAQPLTGLVRAPQPLDGPRLPTDSADDRREALAAWVTSTSNPYFSRALANRVWAHFMNVGLVEKVDDLRLTNPASNEELLQSLAEHLVKNHYDVKSLIRLIMNSAAYQRSSEPVEGNQADKRYYSRYYPKRMMAEVMLDAISQVTEAPSSFPGYPEHWRALQLPDSRVASYFLQTFGRPERAIVCDCERTSEPNMVQVLHLSNGDAINKKLDAKGNRLDRQLASGLAPAAIIEELCLAALCRYPTLHERREMEQILTSAKPSERRAALQDIYWGVLGSKEFLFNR